MYSGVEVQLIDNEGGADTGVKLCGWAYGRDMVY